MARVVKKKVQKKVQKKKGALVSVRDREKMTLSDAIDILRVRISSLCLMYTNLMSY